MPMDITPDRKLSLLVESMRDEFGEDDGFTEFVPIPRKYWNDQNGERVCDLSIAFTQLGVRFGGYQSTHY